MSDCCMLCTPYSAFFLNFYSLDGFGEWRICVTYSMHNGKPTLWQASHREGPTTPFTTPKPDIWLQFIILYGRSFDSLVVADSAPVICDQTLQLAGVTIEIQPFETPHWISPNLHSAAMMLRQLRSRWRPQWRYIWLQWKSLNDDLFHQLQCRGKVSPIGW